jgi:hypothetical protein
VLASPVPVAAAVLDLFELLVPEAAVEDAGRGVLALEVVVFGPLDVDTGVMEVGGVMARVVGGDVEAP